MNLSDTISIDENQIQHLFAEAGLLDAPATDQRRVDQVVERAMHETVIKDLSSFMFEGFPAVVDAMMSVATGKIHHRDNDYKA